MKYAFYSRVAVAIFFLLGQSPARPQETAEAARSRITAPSSYPNSTDGLRLQLGHVLAAAKSGDGATVEADIKDMEIPNYVDWFASTFGEEKGNSSSGPYGAELKENEKQLQELFIQLAQEDGEISATKVASYAKPDSLEWGLSHGLKHPADYYLTEFRPADLPKSASGELIGYFVFVDGKFRWDSTIQVLKAVMLDTDGVQSFSAAAAHPGDHADSDTVYVSERFKLVLTVPHDWQTNDALARARFDIGAFTSADESIVMRIKLMPGAQDPGDFAKAFDAQGGRLFPGYRKIDETHMLVDGNKCEAIEFQAPVLRQAADGLPGSAPLQSWMVFIAAERALVVLHFVTSSSQFDAARQTFKRIVMSYHSTATTQATPSP